MWLWPVSDPHSREFLMDHTHVCVCTVVVELWNILFCHVDTTKGSRQSTGQT